MKKIAYWLSVLAIALYEHLMMYQSAYKEDAEVNYIIVLISGIILFFAVLLSIGKKKYYNSKISRLFIFLLSGMFVLGVVLFRGSLFSSIVNLLLLSIPLLSYVFTYNFFLKNSDKTLFQKSTQILLVFVVIVYFQIFLDLRNSGIDKALNIAYFPMLLLPSVLVSNPKPHIKWLSIIVVCLIVFSAMKRGGIIALASGLFVYFSIDKLNSSRVSKFAAIISISFILSIFIVSFIKFDSLMDGAFTDRLENIADDGGSGRTTVYAVTISMIYSSDLASLLIGHGRDAVRQDSVLELSAHNDFLEFIYDYGIILFVFYLLFNIKLITNIYNLIKLKSRYAAAMSFAYVSYLIFSMISHVFLYGYFLFYILLWAYVWGNEDRNKSLTIK